MVIGIDPGSHKAGYALLDDSGAVVEAGIEPIDRLLARIAALVARHSIEALAVGRGTNVRAIKESLRGLAPAMHMVDEYETTRDARSLYFAEHPPRGLRRLIPLGLQTPPRPVDDYAAILIARRFLARGREAQPPS